MPAGFASTHLTTVRLALRGDAGDFTASVDAEGAFVFSEVPAAEWRLGAEGPFLAAEQFLPLRAGDAVDLGTLPLTANARSTVLGTVRLAGAEDHAGALVSVPGTPFVATSAADGAFTLAARVAQMLGADVLVLLSDIDGLYDADPRSHPNASHIAEVRKLTPEIAAMAGGANVSAGVGSGGMSTKIDAARIALTAGCSTLITLGANATAEAGPLAALASGARGTWFLTDLSPETARKQWLAGALRPTGSVRVDAGAARALKTGKSLLAAGVTAVAGRFERGDAVDVTDPDGATIARAATCAVWDWNARASSDF